MESAWPVESSESYLFAQIMYECRHNALGQSFSKAVRDEIERLKPEARAALVARQRAGATALIEASMRGNLPLVQYLVEACGAPLEQRGVRPIPLARDDRATPLWAAAVDGRADVVEALARAGADVNARSDSGVTPLRAACLRAHEGVARQLLAAGADVRLPDCDGAASLAGAVCSVPLCRLLLAAGAEVDACDALCQTALHRAVREYREEAVLALLAAGADAARRTVHGDDALQLACLRGAARLATRLAARGGYSAARLADAHELLGATQMDIFGDSHTALASWHTATAMRAALAEDGGAIPKRPRRAPTRALDGVREWTTRAELDARAHDLDWLRAQALLVTLRVLGPRHPDTLARMERRGSAYAADLQLDRCAALWTWVLELRIARDTLFDTRACWILTALMQLLVRREWPGAPRVALGVIRLVVAAAPECQRLLRVQPACRAQGMTFDTVLRSVLHVLHVAHAAADDADDAFDRLLAREVRALVSLRACTFATGDSLLHLACSAHTNIVVAPPPGTFPSARVALLLLRCGADVSHRNRARCTPLHLATIPHNFRTEVAEGLLACGAHLDVPERWGASAAELVQACAGSRVRPVLHVSLACRAARALAPAAPRALPAALQRLLELHSP